MGLMSEENCDGCMLGSTNLFKKRTIQESIEDSQMIRYYPVQSLDGANSMQFKIPGVQLSYLDTSHMELGMELQVTKADGADLAANDIVAVENCIHQVMISGIDVSANQTNLTPPSNMHNILAYMMILLNYGGAAKRGHLQTMGWHPCAAGKFADANDDGFKKRVAMVAGSKKFHVHGRVIHPLFMQGTAIPSSTDVLITIHRARDSLCLVDLTAPAVDPQPQFKLKILDAALHVKHIRPTQKALLQDAMDFEKGAARYFLNRPDVKMYTIPSAVSAKNLNSILVGPLPKRITVGLFSTAALQGDYKKSGLEMKHFNIRNIAVVVGSKRYPSTPYNIVWGDKNYVRAYSDLYHGLGMHHANRDIDITLDDFAGGYCVFSFDITPSHSASEMSYYDGERDGDVSIELSFNENTAETISVVVVCEHNQLMTVDKHRNVKVDIAP